MTVITIRLIVAADGSMSAADPLPPGSYLASIEMDEAPARRLPTLPFDPENPDDLPVHDLGPWPEGLSLRREDLYGDDGR